MKITPVIFDNLLLLNSETFYVDNIGRLNTGIHSISSTGTPRTISSFAELLVSCSNIFVKYYISRK